MHWIGNSCSINTDWFSTLCHHMYSARFHEYDTEGESVTGFCNVHRKYTNGVYIVCATFSQGNKLGAHGGVMHSWLEVKGDIQWGTCQHTNSIWAETDKY